MVDRRTLRSKRPLGARNSDGLSFSIRVPGFGLSPKQQEIRSWEKVQLEIIEVQKEFLLTALDKTFDERSEKSCRLFDDLESALVSGAEDAAARVADILAGIMEFAKTSPFKESKSPEIVVQEFLQSGRAIELWSRVSPRSRGATGLLTPF